MKTFSCVGTVPKVKYSFPQIYFFSPGLEDSESSSDISVLSNPSECSIEVLEAATPTPALHLNSPTPALHLSSAVTPPAVQARLEGSVSSGLTSSGNSQDQVTGCMFGAGL